MLDTWQEDESIDTWEEDELDLGSCCACGCKTGVHNILMLEKLCPTPGRGWGCFICGLPMDGAVAVVCDACLEADRELKWACAGYPASDGRLLIENLKGDFHHDPARHDLEEKRR